MISYSKPNLNNNLNRKLLKDLSKNSGLKCNLSTGDQPFRSVKPNEVNISQFFVRYIKEDDVNCVYTMCGSS